MSVPSTYLFVTWEGGGNVPPVLGVARRLADRGHRVHVLSEPSIASAVEHAGAAFIPFERHFVRTDASVDLSGDWQVKHPIGSLKRSLENVMFGPAGIVAEETRRAIDGVDADVVVVDLMMPGALVAAEAANVPRAVLFHFPEYLPGPGRPAAGPGFLPRNDILGRARDHLFTSMFLRLLSSFVPRFNDVRRTHGLAPLADARDLLGEFHRADLRLIQTSEAFDFPITPRPANVRYVGPVLDDPSWTADAWSSPWPEGDPRPLVTASLSTTFQDQAATLQRLVDAIGAVDVRGLVTLGPAMADAPLRVPSNVVTTASAPHALVFPHASLVVTHAGHGTVMRALAHGLPLVCLPMGRDQDDNAARVTYHGAGIRLKPTASAERIRAAVEEVLGDERYRTGAARLREAILADVAATRDVLELEALVPARAEERLLLSA